VPESSEHLGSTRKVHRQDDQWLSRRSGFSDGNQLGRLGPSSGLDNGLKAESCKACADGDATRPAAHRIHRGWCSEVIQRWKLSAFCADDGSNPWLPPHPSRGVDLERLCDRNVGAPHRDGIGISSWVGIAANSYEFGEMDRGNQTLLKTKASSRTHWQWCRLQNLHCQPIFTSLHSLRLPLLYRSQADSVIGAIGCQQKLSVTTEHKPDANSEEASSTGLLISFRVPEIGGMLHIERTCTAGIKYSKSIHSDRIDDFKLRIQTEVVNRRSAQAQGTPLVPTWKSPSVLGSMLVRGSIREIGLIWPVFRALAGWAATMAPTSRQGANAPASSLMLSPKDYRRPFPEY
jgi:hypothetical protein